MLYKYEYPMILEWCRANENQRLIAWGYYLAIREQLDAVDQMYYENIHKARNKGVSA